MNTFLLLVVLNQTMYVALDDERPSKQLYSEMTRDWTASRHMTKEALPLAKSINADIEELKTLVKIEFQRPHFLKEYPSFRFSKYEKWEAFDRRSFISSGWAYKTLMYQAYSYYQKEFNEKFEQDHYKECKQYLEDLYSERVKFAAAHKNYVVTQPISHRAGWGDVYNLHTRKYEDINFRKRPLFDLSKYTQWHIDKKKAILKFCTLNAEDYTRHQPYDHRAGWGDVYNLITRKYEDIESKLTEPVLMELRVDPLPYVSD